jgi:hypothetical protein
MVVDIPASQRVYSSWPTPIVISGFEIGLSMLYPGRVIQHDYAYVAHHPIADSYRIYCEERKSKGAVKGRCPIDHDHATFDLTAVLYGARPDRGYFSLSKPGKISVLDDGSTRFEAAAGGLHRYLIQNELQRARTLEAMIELTTEPPVLGAKPHH